MPLASLHLINWSGRPPVVGEYLRTARGRTAYEVCSIERCKGTPSLGRGTYKVKAERHPAGEVPEGATVIEFQWLPRGSRQKRTG